jgi:hypothetical protein
MPVLRTRILRTSVLLVAGAVAALGLASSAGAAPPRKPTSTALYPDIIEQVPHHIQVQNTQQREWLRFSTTHMNIGSGNLQIRGTETVYTNCVDDNGDAYEQCTTAVQEIFGPDGTIVETQPAGVAVFHPEHNHWHQSGVAEFTIATGVTPTGPTGVITSGTKVTFCLIDVIFFGDGKTTGSDKKVLPRSYFECNGDLQGVSVGWGDQYHQSTPLQELDITGLAPGTYYLTHLADPENHWKEGPDTASVGENNNFTWVQFQLSRDSEGNAKVDILGDSGCVSHPAQCGFGGNA